MPSPSRSASDPRTGLPGKDAYSRWLDPVEFKVVLKVGCSSSPPPESLVFIDIYIYIYIYTYHVSIYIYI